MTAQQNSGPAPRPLSDDEITKFLGEHRFGTLGTVKKDGHPHLTTMIYHWDPETRTVGFSSTDDRLKVRQLRANPKAAFHVSSADHWTFVYVEGEAEIVGPTTVPGDEVGRALLALLPEEAAPEDPDQWLAQQVAEKRVLIRLKAARLFGQALDITG